MSQELIDQISAEQAAIWKAEDRRWRVNRMAADIRKNHIFSWKEWAKGSDGQYSQEERVQMLTEAIALSKTWANRWWSFCNPDVGGYF